MMEQKKWRCTICGYVHVGQRPPSHCPICGVGAGMFEEIPTKDLQATQKVVRKG